MATAAGLTPSYLSFIENRKKPPPSDDVCTRLAGVLGLPPAKLLEAAHLERTPETVRKRLRSLRTRVRRERKSRLRILRALLSPFLFAGPQGLLEGALDQVSISPTRRRRLRQALAAVGRHNQDRADAVADALEELPERERAVLLEVLPKLLDDKALGRGKARTPPPKAAGPERLAAPPPPGTAQAPFLLEAGADLAAGAPDAVAAGDTLLVDPGLEPRPGDLVLLHDAGGTAALLRLAEDAPEGTLIGTVVEIRRPLRR